MRSGVGFSSDVSSAEKKTSLQETTLKWKRHILTTYSIGLQTASQSQPPWKMTRHKQDFSERSAWCQRCVLCDVTIGPLACRATCVHGRRKVPLDFEIWHFPIKFLDKKGCFLCFDWVKWIFIIFGPALEKSFRRSRVRPLILDVVAVGEQRCKSELRTRLTSDSERATNKRLPPPSMLCSAAFSSLRLGGMDLRRRKDRHRTSRSLSLSAKQNWTWSSSFLNERLKHFEKQLAKHLCYAIVMSHRQFG